MISTDHNTQYLYQLANVNLNDRVSGHELERNKECSIIDCDCIDEKKSVIRQVKKYIGCEKNQGEFYRAVKNDFILCLKQNFIIGELMGAIITEDEVLVTKEFAIITPKKREYGKILMEAFHNDYVISQIKPLNFGRNYFEITPQEIENLLIPYNENR